jgi:LPS export ABC transporter protein LptC
LSPKRRRIFEFSIGAVIVAGMILLYFIGRARDHGGNETGPNSDLEMQGKFLASRFENGDLKFWMLGKDFSYSQGNGNAELANPVINVSNEKVSVMIKGGKAQYLKESKVIHLDNQVEITSQRYIAQTPSLVYDLGRKECRSDREIVVHGNGMELQGKGYIYNVGNGRISILSGVKGRFKKTEG